MPKDNKPPKKDTGKKAEMKIVTKTTEYKRAQGSKKWVQVGSSTRTTINEASGTEKEFMY